MDKKNCLILLNVKKQARPAFSGHDFSTTSRYKINVFNLHVICF